MVAYQDFVALCRSDSSDERGQAAHLAAKAYLGHTGPADEHAALYAALIGFLDDPSVKVRAALAYGLLHAVEAPRPVMLALLHDSPVIARAVVQYSPALIDADLVGFVRGADPAMLPAVAMREQLSGRVAGTVIARGLPAVTLALLQRRDVPVPVEDLERLAQEGVADARIRGALLARPDLPGTARLALVEAATDALRGARMIRGAGAPARLSRLLRHAGDTALTAIGEDEAQSDGRAYAASLIERDRLSTRVMLHAIVNGHVLFFADCVAELCQVPRDKVFTLLETGNRAALNALLARCGLGEAVRNLISRLIVLARAADLADDVAARHFVVTVLTEELIVEHDAAIPPALEEAFAYLSEQNVMLARQAARGVMAAFAEEAPATGRMRGLPEDEPLALPAA